ncbi:MAG: hypothetical protein M3326_12810, partial [Actinomycetota bacterium]|nr:hypothetical protein [Actinomycetota bacterium]
PASPPPADVYVVDPYVDPYVNPYVNPYVGASAAVGAPVGDGVRRSGPPLSGSGGTVSVTDAALGDPPTDRTEGDRRLVTGWDVVSITALGLTAVVGLSASAARFRSR